MMLAASPPLYSPVPCRAANAAFTDSALQFLPSSAARSTLRTLRRLAMNNNTNQNSNNSFNSPKPTAAMLSPAPSTPLRSCLVLRKAENTPTTPSPPSSPEIDSLDSPTTPLGFHKNKKRVIFADDRGLALAQIKVMTEPSECPPRWSADFLEQVTGGVTAEVTTPGWDVLFRQPAADYLDFRARVERQSVSLESCVVQEGVAEPALVGTVKVRNVSYNKSVTIRITWDNWTSFKEFPADYVQASSPACAAGAVNLLDTFSFKIPIPNDDTVKTCQFCVRFNSDANEFWDSNDGKNYSLEKQMPLPKTPSSPLTPPTENKSTKRRPCNSPNQRAVGVLNSELPSWADFSSWNHLLNDGPYW